MKRFSVEIHQQVNRYADLEVEAECAQDAKEIAWYKLDSGEIEFYEKINDSDCYARQIDGIKCVAADGKV